MRLLSASLPIRAARHPGRRQAPPTARRSPSVDPHSDDRRNGRL